MTQNALVPFADMQRMADTVAKSKLFGVKTPEEALTIMMLAQAEGRHPMSAAKDYDIINGKPAKKAEAMLRDFIESGGKVEWHKYADDGADATFTHPEGGSVRVDWNKERMLKAQIKNDAMYTKYPRAMYRARCISEGVRTVCPAATGGLYVPDEVRAFQPPEKNMGKAEVVREEPKMRVTPEQIEAIHEALAQCNVTETALLAEINARSSAEDQIDKLADLASEDAPGAVKWIRRQKK